MKKIYAYYATEVLPVDIGENATVTVVEKDFYDKNHALDEGEAPNAEKIEDAMSACGFSILAENLYEADDEDYVFNREDFEATAADNGVIMIFNPEIGQCDCDEEE